MICLASASVAVVGRPSDHFNAACREAPRVGLGDRSLGRNLAFFSHTLVLYWTQTVNLSRK